VSIRDVENEAARRQARRPGRPVRRPQGPPLSRPGAKGCAGLGNDGGAWPRRWTEPHARGLHGYRRRRADRGCHQRGHHLRIGAFESDRCSCWRFGRRGRQGPSAWARCSALAATSILTPSDGTRRRPVCRLAASPRGRATEAPPRDGRPAQVHGGTRAVPCSRHNPLWPERS
jgi:hypothetical protein